MNGINVAEALHTVLALPPQTISGGATAQAFSMKQADHASILITFGAEGGSPPTLPTSIVVNACTDANGSNPQALASFRYYYQTQGGAGHDILDGNAGALPNTVGPGPNWTTSTAGITSFPTSVSNLVYIIEIDSTELAVFADTVGATTEYPYLQVVLANGAYATYVAITVLLSGQRFAYKGGASATV